MQLLCIKHHKRRINTLFRLKLCMTFTVKFYDALLLCSDSNVLPSRESEPSMQMRFVLSGVSSPILIRSLVLLSFMLLKLRSTVAVVTGRSQNHSYFDRLVWRLLQCHHNKLALVILDWAPFVICKVKQPKELQLCFCTFRIESTSGWDTPSWPSKFTFCTTP